MFKMNEKEARFFHFMTSKILSLYKRGQPEIEIKIAFHSSRVKELDEDDLKKVIHLRKYLDETIDKV
jgi:hypothetical protein